VRRAGWVAAALLAAAPVHARSLYVLTTDGRIALVPESQPGQAAGATAVTGLVAGDVLVAIDVRPLNARLYGLGFNSSAGTVQLYLLTVDGAGARANPVGAAVVFDVPILGAQFGIDFNPTVDRLRVVNDAGQNFRLNPTNGTPVDGNPGLAGVQVDGAISGGTTVLHDTAYVNNAINATVTTQYTLDSSTNRLFIQNPPNNGTQTGPVNVTLGGSPLDFGGECGLDIPFDVNVSVANSIASGKGLAALSVGGISALYRIDLTSGVATLVGAFGVTARDVAIAPELAPALALTSPGTMLLRFAAHQPSSVIGVTVTGVAAGERLVGIDSRPATGQVMGLGINPAANTGTVYLVDPQTGAATAIGAAGQVALVDAAGFPVDYPDTSYAVSFNPTVDRMRVIATSGLNFRVNPINGAAVDGNVSTPGINPDGPVNGPAGIGISGAANTNNLPGVTVTTLYTLDPAGNRLFIQNPPNNGTQVAGRAVTLDGLQFDFDTDTGFDIPPGVDAAINNAEATGEGYAALSVPGATVLYRLALPGAELARVGTVGSGATPVAGLVVWIGIVDVIFADGFE
jgi:hypothetical protein